MLKMGTLDNEKYREHSFQDIVSQFPLLNAYTNYLGFYRLGDDVSRALVVSSLRHAFEEVKNKVPWLGYGVVNVRTDSNGVDSFVARPWPATLMRLDFSVKNCDHRMATFSELARARFPASMLNAQILEPFPSLPEPAKVSPAPVAALQVSFIQGGVIVTISNHHIMMDGTGLIAFRRMISTVLNGREIPEEDITAANMDRARVIPLLSQNEPIKDHSHLLRPRPECQEMRSTPSMPTTAKWRVFSISRKAVEEIGSRAKDRSSPSWIPQVSQVSTNDALAAFCWQRIAAVRLPILQERRRCQSQVATSSSAEEPQLLTRFGRAIDARRTMGIPPSYMGHMVYHAALWLPLSTVASAPLPFLACALRRTLDEANNPWSVRSYATFLSRQSDRTGLLYGGPQNPETDLGLSSLVTAFNWEGEPSLDFGPLLGRSVAWRKANHAPIPGCLYFLDTETERSTDFESGNHVQSILLCLPESELDALYRDPQWIKYFQAVVEPIAEFVPQPTYTSRL